MNEPHERPPGGDRQERLAAAIRRNRARRIRQPWLNRFRAETGIRVSDGTLLPLPETVALKRRFYELVRAGGDAHLFWSRQETDALFDKLRRLAGQNLPSIVLFSSVDEDIGALELPAEAVLLRAERVWESVEIDLAMASRDCSDGLCLGESMYDADGNFVAGGVYELVCWGRLTVF